jgi:VIT1/CCC1 family predicted Fe2+/Mn2+ transporter
VLVTGLAGLLAGAGSMAMGEWISVQSARELYGRQIAIERDELTEVPDEEAEELALIYEAKGMTQMQARELADRQMANREGALDTLAREELGINPEELGGSAPQAAATSFVLFAIGAIVPVLPFFFGGGTTAVVVSAILAALALFGIGAAITLMTGRSVWRSGLRQVLIGGAAAALTYGVGRLIGTAVGRRATGSARGRAPLVGRWAAMITARCLPVGEARERACDEGGAMFAHSSEHARARSSGGRARR